MDVGHERGFCLKIAVQEIENRVCVHMFEEKINALEFENEVEAEA